MKSILNKINRNSMVLNPTLQHIFKVTELFNYDMIYIYHHIQEGTPVRLIKDDLQIGGNHSYSVYYKNFKLGSLFVSSFFTAQYGVLDQFEGRVANITKEKYLPIKNLDIVITQADLRLVS